MGSTLSAPWAYLQKQGWPWIGIPASFEILRSWSVKFLSPGGEAFSPEPRTAAAPTTAERVLRHRTQTGTSPPRHRACALQHPASTRHGKHKTKTYQS